MFVSVHVVVCKIELRVWNSIIKTFHYFVTLCLTDILKDHAKHHIPITYLSMVELNLLLMFAFKRKFS